MRELQARTINRPRNGAHTRTAPMQTEQQPRTGERHCRAIDSEFCWLDQDRANDVQKQNRFAKGNKNKTRHI